MPAFPWHTVPMPLRGREKHRALCLPDFDREKGVEQGH
jgi:hypothetical protein